MRKLYPISIILVLTLFFSSCQDNTTSINQNTKEGNKQIKTPSVEGKSLVFDSSNDFKGFVQNLQQKSYSELDKFVKQKAHGFTSLKMAQEHIRKKKTKNKSNNLTIQEEKILYLNVEDPAFASILNKDGVFQVGKQIFKITNKYTYIFKDKGAYQNFQPPKKKSSNPSLSYVKPCEEIRQEPVRIRQDVYRVENCGGSGGGSYDPGDDDDDNSYPNQDVIDLDPRKNLDKNYPDKITQEYRSGGTKGRLKGKSWCQDFFIYSSIGAKSVHQRHTWLNWWNRSAEKITLDSFVKYGYGKKEIPFHKIKVGLEVNWGDFAANKVESFLSEISFLNSNQTVTKILLDQISGQKIKINVFKHSSPDTYDIYMGPQKVYRSYTKTKYDAKKIRKGYDWSTAIVSNAPPYVENSAVDFDLEILRSKHTLKHDGYHLGFITGRKSTQGIF
ncbi:hypothetical protein [Fodinibius saliphilus]|uniref:hypothetical protein n=1 Tax=Fodinibius saliphilus TaxID=1920650 RepID=UPI001107B586|nr:hypothetical protein [Fodinibius saliphilus]